MAGFCPECFFKYIVVICRGFGIIVCISLWGIGVNHLSAVGLKSFPGWYIIAMAVVITFFELLWIIDLSPCIANSGGGNKCWSCLLWIEDWRKTILYILLTIPLFWNSYISSTVVLIAVILIIVLGLFYVVKSFDTREIEKSRPQNNETTKILSQPYAQLEDNPEKSTIVIYKEPEETVMPDPGPRR